MPGVDVRVLDDDVADDDPHSMSYSQVRKVELFRRLARADAGRDPAGRRITFRFGLQPAGFSGRGAVDSLHLRKTRMANAPLEVIRTGLVIRSVGYQVVPAAGLPYDPSTKTLANAEGRLVEEGTDRVIWGLFCVGWAKRGPSGVIGTNKVCAKETVDALLADLRNGRLPAPTLSKDALDAAIRTRQPRAVTLAGWRAIDAWERQDGQSAVPAKPRRKLVRLEPMLNLAVRPDAASTRVPLPASTSGKADA